MKLLDTILYDLIIEGVEDVEKIYSTYFSKIPKNRFELIAKLDSRTKFNNEGRIENLGKYARLLLKLYMNQGLKYEDFQLAKEYVDLLYKHNVSVDWSKIGELSDLYRYVDKYLAKTTSDFHDILNYVTEGTDFKKVFDGKQYEIYVPLTEKGSCYLGVGSEWCTTWGPMSLNDRNKDKTNRFKYYNEEGPLYIIVNRADPTHRVQWHFPNKEFKNLQNSDVDPKKYLENSEELLNFFFPISETTDEKTLRKYLRNSNYIPHEHYNKIRKVYADKIEVDISETIQVTPEFFSEEQMMNLITDSTIESIRLGKIGQTIIFEMKNYDRRTNNVITRIEDYTKSLSQQKDNMSPSSYMFDGATEYLHENLRDLCKEYHEKNKEKLIGMFGVSVNDFDNFYQGIEKNFLNDFENRYVEEYDRMNYGNLEDAFNDEIREIDKYIEVDSGYGGNYEVRLNIAYFNTYNLENNIRLIDDFETYIEGYCDKYNVPTDSDYFDYPQFDFVNPSLDGFESDMDDFFESLAEEYNPEIVEKLNSVLVKYFNSNYEYEDKSKFIKVLIKDVDYLDGKIKINYTNKKNGEKYSGYVKIDNLPNYVGIDMLAETYFKLNKIFIN